MLYAYCVVDKQVAVAHVTTGIGGGKIKSLTNCDLTALVSDFVGESVGITRENVLRHDAVIRNVLEQTTPLPFRFGTLVTPEQLESFLQARSDALKAKLIEVRDCVEMSVKVIWEPEPVMPLEPEDTSGSQGAAFLRAKRREILGDESLMESAIQLKAWLQDGLSPFFRAQDVSVRPSQKLVISASHLVERLHLAGYQEAVKAVVAERPDLHFLVSGPWAPYSFVNIDLEFKTHFGVS